MLMGYGFSLQKGKNNTMNAVLGISAVVLFMFAGCRNHSDQVQDTTAYQKEILDWQENRLNNLKGPEGWLNLAGLFWLEEGKNTFGSDSINTIIFPENTPDHIGIIERRGDSAILRDVTAPVMINGKLTPYAVLNHDSSGKPDMMMLDSFAWYIIKRGDRLGIRLRDYASDMIDSLTHIPCYSIDAHWRISARFMPYAKPEVHKVSTVVGIDEENTVPGELHFRINGNRHILYPFQTGGGFFIVFGDETNGTETYAAGRFLYTALPDKDNQVIIDFNKSYNPPCAFTPFATCPLPLRKNILPVRIEAGEKAVHLFHHHHP
jgi:hypothetical protein